MTDLLHRLLLAGLFVVLFGGPIATLASAQQPGADSSSGELEVPNERPAEGFIAVSGGQQEDVPGGPLVLAAYFGILTLLFFYLYRQSRLVGAAESDLAALRAEALRADELR